MSALTGDAMRPVGVKLTAEQITSRRRDASKLLGVAIAPYPREIAMYLAAGMPPPVD